MKRKIRRGDLFYANLTCGVGSEQKGVRPILIIQNDKGKRTDLTSAPTEPRLGLC